MKDLDLILPAYQPEPGWTLQALKYLGELKQLRPAWSIRLITSADGSRQGHSPEEHKQLLEGMQRISPELSEPYLALDYGENRGKGAALRWAVGQSLESRPEAYVLYTDWDFPFSMGSYLDALDALSRGAEVVLPVRDTSLYRSLLRPWRRLLSSGSRLLNRLLLALPSADTQGGIKAFDPAMRSLFLKTRIDRFLCDTEFIAMATRQGRRIALTAALIRPEVQMSAMSARTLLSELPEIPRLLQARYR